MAVWRDATTLQVGLEEPFTLADSPARGPAIVAALQSPDISRRDLDALGADAPWLARLRQGLVERGLLTPPGPALPVVAIVGRGPLAAGVARLLDGSARVARVTDGTGAPTARRPPSFSLLDPWELPRERPAVTVLADTTVEADRRLAAELTEARLPHLIVRHEDGRAVVGPFVTPGVGPCLRCIDLARRDLDPAWPAIVGQLQRLHTRPDRLTAAWASSTAAAQVASYLAGGRPDAVGATLELTPDRAVEVRPWASHPECAHACSASTAKTASP